MSLRGVQTSLALILAATIATSAEARTADPCPSTTMTVPADRGTQPLPAVACAAMSGKTGRTEFMLGLILIGCAAGIGGQASRRRGVKLVFS